MAFRTCTFTRYGERFSMIRKNTFIIALCFFLLEMFTPLNVAWALSTEDTSYRMQNDILYYQQCSSAISTTPPTSTGSIASNGVYQAGVGINNHLFIIVHTTEGDTAASAEQALLSKGYSYHALIEQNGAVIRLLPDSVNAIGAGGANSNSLQVSLVGRVGADGGSHFDPQSPQLQSLSRQIAEWANKYKIPIQKVAFNGQNNTKGVIGHIDIHDAASEGHTDPGVNFPWEKVLANARTNNSSSLAMSGIPTTINSQSSGSSSSAASCCPVTAGGGGGGGSFNSTSGGGGGCGDKTGSQANKQQVWSFLKSKGLSDESAAGIMGNIQGESGFNPTATNPGGCIGIAQWCDRAGSLKDFAAQKGTDWNCLGTQLEYMWQELSSSNYNELKDALNGSYTPDQMAMFFRSAYERPGYSGPGGATLPFQMIKDNSYKNLSKSQLGEYYGYDANAQQAYKDFTGKTTSPADNSGTNNASCSNNSDTASKQ